MDTNNRNKSLIRIKMLHVNMSFEDSDPIQPIQKEYLFRTSLVVYDNGYSDRCPCDHLFR